MTLKWMCFVLSVALFGYVTATAVPDNGLTKEASDVQQSRKLTCPAGFTFYEGDVCLHISRDYVNGLPALTWEQARSKCVAMSDSGWNVDLAYPIDAELLMQINDYLEENEPEMKGYVYFVGAHKPESSQWQWADGQPLDLTSYIWLPNYPGEQLEALYGQLVPAGAHERRYMISVSDLSQGPSWICQATLACSC